MLLLILAENHQPWKSVIWLTAHDIIILIHLWQKKCSSNSFMASAPNVGGIRSAKALFEKFNHTPPHLANFTVPHGICVHWTELLRLNAICNQASVNVEMYRLLSCSMDSRAVWHMVALNPVWSASRYHTVEWRTLKNKCERNVFWEPALL